MTPAPLLRRLGVLAPRMGEVEIGGMVNWVEPDRLWAPLKEGLRLRLTEDARRLSTELAAGLWEACLCAAMARNWSGAMGNCGRMAADFGWGSVATRPLETAEDATEDEDEKGAALPRLSASRARWCSRRSRRSGRASGGGPCAPGSPPNPTVTST